MNPHVTRWARLIVRVAREKWLSPSLVAGLIDVESAGDPDAVSSSGAVGLMQIEPGEVIQGRPPAANLHDPEVNIQTGCQILVDNSQRYGTWAGALAAYYGAVDGEGHPTGATDGSGVEAPGVPHGVNGWAYVRLVENAALGYLELDQYADEDFQEYAIPSGSWRDAAINLKGIADDALGAGRRMVSLWGKR